MPKNSKIDTETGTLLWAKHRCYRLGTQTVTHKDTTFNVTVDDRQKVYYTTKKGQILNVTKENFLKHWPIIEKENIKNFT